jgi:protein-S-isoprenylcysteine O-methyltransferase Ste14
VKCRQGGSAYFGLPATLVFILELFIRAGDGWVELPAALWKLIWHGICRHVRHPLHPGTSICIGLLVYNGRLPCVFILSTLLPIYLIRIRIKERLYLPSREHTLAPFDSEPLPALLGKLGRT